MKRESENISAEKINEYLRIRGEQYIEKKKNGMTQIQENEFYSNIMEIMSIMDFAGITLSINNSSLIYTIRKSHYSNTKSKIY